MQMAGPLKTFIGSKAYSQLLVIIREKLELSLFSRAKFAIAEIRRLIRIRANDFFRINVQMTEDF